tara:strand:- start:193 stop:414 length:222 start_codon:yes stop_codon:yes gene_type:complete
MEQSIEHFNWCVENNIRIYPKPVERGMQNKLYYICVEINKKESCGKDYFENKEIAETIYKYYKYYYDKYNKQI